MGATTHIVTKYNQHDGTLITDKGFTVALGSKRFDSSI